MSLCLIKYGVSVSRLTLVVSLSTDKELGNNQNEGLLAEFG